MKKIIALLLLIPSVSFCDTKISALPSTTTLNSSDIIPVVTNPGTSPANFSITKSNLLATLGVIQNQATLQPGSTVYVTSVTVSGPLNVTGSGYIAGTLAIGQLNATPGSAMATILSGNRILHASSGVMAGDNNLTYDGGTLSATSAINTNIAGQLNSSGVSTFTGNIAVSSGVLLNGSAGTNGQAFTSGGPGTIPSWTTISGGAGSGIVSPGTFTWQNTQGISVSTISMSTMTFANQIPYVGSGGYLVANTSYTYGEALGGQTGIENLKIEGLSPFVVMGSSNAMGWEWFDDYHKYQNVNLWSAIILHPNAFPSISQGNLNPYVRDGGFMAFDVTSPSTRASATGFFQFRTASPADEATPRTVLQINATSQVLIDDMYENCSSIGGATNQSCPQDLSTIFLTSSTKAGSVPCPPMTTTQKNAISSPKDGLCVYDVSVSSYSYYSKPANSWWFASNGGSGVSPSTSTFTLNLSSNVALTNTATFVSDSNLIYSLAGTTITLSVAPVGIGGSGYSYQRQVVIDHTQVSNTDQINFPVPVTLTDVSLSTISANGGHVRNPNGYDVVFSTMPDCSFLMSWDTETYNAGTGAVVAWVKVSSVSTSVNVPFYMCYGNPAITTYQGNSQNVWTNGFQGVYHMGSAGVTVESSSNTTTGTNHGVTQVTTGKIGGAGGFNSGSSQYMTVGASTDYSFGAGATLHAWTNLVNAGAWNALISKANFGTDRNGYGMFQNTTAGKMWGELDSASASQQPGFSSVATATGTWHDIEMSWDGTTFKYYMDGVQVLSTAQTVVPFNTANSLFIGVDSSLTYFSSGTIDEIELSYGARSADWIKTTYNAQNNPASFAAVGTESILANGHIALLNSTSTWTATQTFSAVQVTSNTILSGTTFYQNAPAIINTLSISTNGFTSSNGPSPVISACGSTPSGSVVGDDSRGVITVGGTAPTACTLTFSTVHTGCTMACNVSDNSLTISADIGSLTTSALTLGFGVGGLAGGSVWYQCSGFGPGCH